MNKARKVTFAKTSTHLKITIEENQVESQGLKTTSKPLVPSTSVKSSTNASGSIPKSTTKNTRILQTSISNQKYQRVEAHTRNVKSSLDKGNRLGLHQLIPGYISSGLVQNLASPTPYVPPSKKDSEILFQLLIDEYFNCLPRAVSPDPVSVASPRDVDQAGSPSSNYH
ncbi:hypothetical protein Tco_0198907 [Tanacetum coccineum]